MGLGCIGTLRLVRSQIEWMRLEFTNGSTVPHYLKLCPDVSKRPEIDLSRKLWGDDIL